jgi:hypothetical protein
MMPAKPLIATMITFHPLRPEEEANSPLGKGARGLYFCLREGDNPL